MLSLRGAPLVATAAPGAKNWYVLDPAGTPGTDSEPILSCRRLSPACSEVRWLDMKAAVLAAFSSMNERLSPVNEFQGGELARVGRSRRDSMYLTIRGSRKGGPADRGWCRLGEGEENNEACSPFVSTVGIRRQSHTKCSTAMGTSPGQRRDTKSPSKVPLTCWVE